MHSCLVKQMWIFVRARTWLGTKINNYALAKQTRPTKLAEPNWTVWFLVKVSIMANLIIFYKNKNTLNEFCRV